MSVKSPFFSIIAITNHKISQPKTLPTFLSSQTFTDFEIIHSNDLNHSLSVANGHYILFLDPTDSLASNALSDLHHLATTRHPDLVLSNFIKVIPNNPPTKTHFIPLHATDRLIDPKHHTHLFLSPLVLGSILYRRDFLIKNHLQFTENTSDPTVHHISFTFNALASTNRVQLTTNAYLLHNYDLSTHPSANQATTHIFPICQQYEAIETFLKSKNIYDDLSIIMWVDKFQRYKNYALQQSRERFTPFLESISLEFQSAINDHIPIDLFFTNTPDTPLLKSLLDGNISRAITIIQRAKHHQTSQTYRNYHLFRPYRQKAKLLQQYIDNLKSQNESLAQQIIDYSVSSQIKTKAQSDLKPHASSPLISIIVPAHNVEPYLDKCLGSLSAQTYSNLEIICINDHSEDQTFEILKTWQSRDPRIKILNSKSYGVSATRNLGLDHAKGEFIMFCDSDDFYESTTCHDMSNAIRKNNADIALCDINFIYQTHQEKRLIDEDYSTLRYSGFHAFNNIDISRLNIFPVNKIFRKSIIDHYHIRFPEGRYYEDAYFSFAYFYCCRTFEFLHKYLYNYIRRPGSTMSITWSTQDARDTAIDHIHVIIELYHFLKKNHLFSSNVSSFWRIFLIYTERSIFDAKTKSKQHQNAKFIHNFIKTHATDFSHADPYTRNRLLTILFRFHACSLDSTLIKRLLLQFLPTLKIQIDNIEQLNIYQRENQKLLDHLNQLLKKYS